MERPHILFLIDNLYSRLGGTEGVLWNITRRLPPEQYRCSVATFAAHPDEVVTDQFPCPVHLFPLRRMYDWQALETALRLAKLIRSERVSIVHTFSTASDLFGGVVAKLAGCPIVISSRRDMGFQRSALHRTAYRLAGGLFDQVHAVGEQVRRTHIEQDGLDPDKVVTVYNGVDVEEIDRSGTCPELSQWVRRGASHVIAYVANVRPVKAVDVLVETAAIVCRHEPQARFLVVGELRDRKYLAQITEVARRMNVSDNVTFTGLRSDVSALLKACDVFYLPSRSEGLSNALLEAMACRVPCVATNVGGNPELVQDGENGYLVAVDDPEGAAQSILKLLRDPSGAVRMGQAGRRIVETRFSVQAMMNKLLELYDGMLLRRESHPETAVARRRA